MQKNVALNAEPESNVGVIFLKREGGTIKAEGKTMCSHNALLDFL